MLSVLAIPVTIYVIVDHDSLLNTTTPSLDLNRCLQPFQLGKSSARLHGNLIKYFYDQDLRLCFPYRTRSGHDGRNSFETEKECRDRCLSGEKCIVEIFCSEDTFVCGANIPSAGSCNSSATLPQCPDGHICKEGSFISMCCPNEAEESFNHDWNPKCPEAMSIVTTKKEFGEDIFRGKLCRHRFCPENSICYEGKWIAYCCQEND